MGVRVRVGIRVTVDVRVFVLVSVGVEPVGVTVAVRVAVGPVGVTVTVRVAVLVFVEVTVAVWVGCPIFTLTTCEKEDSRLLLIISSR